jgi:5-carboxymethyl-2-hydroxymuconate isomerase
MPHFTVEYSANIEPDVDIAGLVAAVHAAVLETGSFEIGGVRVRAERRDIYKVADGAPDNGFVAILGRIGVGRPAEVRASAAQTIFAAACAYLDPYFAHHPLAISFDLEEIEPVGSLKKNNLHALMTARAQGADR